jgi:hypothetical protein
VFRQSSGKYDCQGWTTERTLPSLIFRLAFSIALSEGYTCGTAKIGTREEVSKFIGVLLLTAQFISTGLASCGLFGKPPNRTSEQSACRSSALGHRPLFAKSLAMCARICRAYFLGNGSLVE